MTLEAPLRTVDLSSQPELVDDLAALLHAGFRARSPAWPDLESVR